MQKKKRDETPRKGGCRNKRRLRHRKGIAIGFAKEGASVVVSAKTEVENLQLLGTIHKTAEEIQALNRQALPIKCDVSSGQSVNEMVEKA